MKHIKDIMETVSAQEHWGTQTKLDICLDYIQRQQSREDIHAMNVKSFDTFEDYLEERADDTKIAQYYEFGECPDCAEVIPEESEGGDNCVNCGHVFHTPRKVD